MLFFQRSNFYKTDHSRSVHLIFYRNRWYSFSFLVPGIGKKYGQILADHGFIYARQLLGYYLMLKDSEMFRKWLEYKFHIPKFRAAESNSMKRYKFFFVLIL